MFWHSCCTIIGIFKQLKLCIMSQDFSIAIHSGKNSEQVVKFIDFEKFTSDFQKAYNNGNIYGCYYDENGNVVAQDVWDEVHENILTA